jgi:hypothetical protein
MPVFYAVDTWFYNGSSNVSPGSPEGEFSPRGEVIHLMRRPVYFRSGSTYKIHKGASK